MRTTILPRATEQAETLQGRDPARAVGDDVTSRILQAAFRGCAFLNAVSEFEDPQSPVRLVVAEHRQWCYQFLRRAFEDAGHQLRANATAIRTFARGDDRLIRTIDAFPWTKNARTPG